MSKLTKRIVDSSYPKPERYYVWDSDLKGFGLKIEPSGTKTYILRYRAGDTASSPKRFMSLGRHGALTPDTARTQATKILGEVATGLDPVDMKNQQKAKQTLQVIAEEFLSSHVNAKRKAKTAVDYQSILKGHILPKFGKMVAEDIKRADISKFHLSLKETPFRANRALAVMASLYTFASKNGYVTEGFNPARGIEKYKEQARARYLSEQEIERLGSSLQQAETIGLPWVANETKNKSKNATKLENRITIFDANIACAFRLLMLTGCRLREILDLKWQDIDFERGLLFLSDSKTGKKTVILSDVAVRILQSHPRASAYVIASHQIDKPRADLKRPWAILCDHAEIASLRLHDLRHTFASIAAGQNQGLSIIGKLLGHTQPQTTARYAHLDNDPLRRATNQVSDSLSQSLGLK